MEERGNLAVVQQLYTAFKAGNISDLLNLLDEEVDWLFYGPAVIPFAGHYHGREGVARFFSKATESIEFLEMEPADFIMASDERVLVQGHERVRIKAIGCIWETNWAHVFTLQNGKITKLREYYDTATIAAAFSGETTSAG